MAVRCVIDGGDLLSFGEVKDIGEAKALVTVEVVAYLYDSLTMP
jgi:hypothetical protein